MTRQPYFAVLVLILVAVAAAQNIQMVSAPPTSPDDAKAMYATYCASCHGNEGKGDGAASVAYKNAKLDLTVLKKNHNGIFPAKYVNTVIAGQAELPAHKTTMPNWQKVFSGLDGSGTASPVVVNRRIHNLTDYIEKMQVK